MDICINEARQNCAIPRGDRFICGEPYRIKSAGLSDIDNTVVLDCDDTNFDGSVALVHRDDMPGVEDRAGHLEGSRSSNAYFY